ncbi:MAG: AAA family ATPase [Alphaproteobacteria bacterium]|nr:AAA family ATPase [Alphaproteobacteria bacterium]
MRRICILGPSSSGKSTLAQALSRKHGIPAYHLDQISHVPHTKWERKPNDVFVKEHDALLTQDAWIIEGNYRVCMPQRIARATEIIWVDPPLLGRLMRYLHRCIIKDPDRHGGLEGAQSEFSLFLIRHTVFRYPQNKKEYKKILAKAPVTPLLIQSMKELNAYYAREGLTR